MKKIAKGNDNCQCKKNKKWFFLLIPILSLSIVVTAVFCSVFVKVETPNDGKKDISNIQNGNGNTSNGQNDNEDNEDNKVIATVKLNNRGGVDGEKSLKIDSNKQADIPKEPKLDNYIFSGWYFDAEYQCPIHQINGKLDFSDFEINGDVTLFAKWIKNSNEVSYTEFESEASFDGYFGKDTSFVVDDFYRGKPVTKISQGAFSNLKYIESITLPKYLKSLEQFCISDCYNLKDLTIPCSVQTIYSNSLFNLQRLQNFKIEDNNANFKTIDGVLLSKNGKQLISYPVASLRTEYSVPSGVEELLDYSFYACSNLKKLNINEGVTKIGKNVFDCCFELSNISFPNSLQEIKSDLTSNKLESNYFGNLRYLGNEENPYLILCKTLKNSYYTYNINQDCKILAPNSFKGCFYLAGIDIPNGVEFIGDCAFKECKNMTSVEVSKTVKKIGREAFNTANVECSLTDINVDSENNSYSSQDGVLFNKDKTELVFYPVANPRVDYNVPKSVEKILDYAFGNLLYLENINFESNSNLIEIGRYNFKNINFSNLKLPENLNIIGENSFDSCVFESLVLSKNLTHIGDYCFRNTKQLESIDFPDSVQYIGKRIFAYSKLNSVKLPNALTEISNNCFENCQNLKEINFPNSITKIGYSAFKNCGFEIVVLPNELISIDSQAFSCCKNLSSIVFNDELLKIDNYAFSNCAKLNSVLLPNSLQCLGQYAFSNCVGLKSFEIGAGLEYFSGLINYCPNIESVSINSNNPNFIIDDGIIYNTEKTILYWYSPLKKLTELNVLPTINIIKSYAINNKFLKTINLPNSVVSVEKEAFCCPNLISINMTNSVTNFECNIPVENLSNNIKSLSYIDNNAETIIIPEGIETLSPQYCFFIMARKIVIPSTLKDLGENVFSQCIRLEEIEVSNVNPYLVCENGAVYSKDKTKLIKYFGFKDKNGNSTDEFIIPNTVKEICENAFAGCLLKNIVIPNSVETIKFNAFANITSLDNLIIPKSVEIIEALAFSGCDFNLYCKSDAKSLNWQSFWLGDNTSNTKAYYYGEETPLGTVQNTWHFNEIGEPTPWVN